MELGITNRVALVTGAGRNIGRAIVLALGTEGARIIIVARTQTHLDDLLAGLPGGPDRHLGIALDLQQSDSAQRLSDSIPGHFGRPEIIVHNLGGSLGLTDPLATAGEWMKVWHFNVGIAHELNRLFLGDMVQRRWGRILHLSTLSTQSFDGHPAYVSAKCALEGYVKSMARRVSRHNVILNILAPGLIDLNGRYYSRLKQDDPPRMEEYFDHHLPIRRMGSAAEIAEIAAFLCSEQAAFMPGSIVRADGGGT
jgi:3-oxoacyl-[acyl-carrier protein] reductase